MDHHSIRQALAEHALRFHSVLRTASVYHTPPTDAVFLDRVQVLLDSATDNVLHYGSELALELRRVPADALWCVSDRLPAARCDHELGYEAMLSALAAMFGATAHTFTWRHAEDSRTLTYGLDGHSWTVPLDYLHAHIDWDVQAPLYRRLDGLLRQQHQQLYDVDTGDQLTQLMVVPAAAVAMFEQYLPRRDDWNTAPGA